MKNIVILFLVVLAFVWFAKMTQTHETANNANLKTKYSAGTSANNETQTQTEHPVEKQQIQPVKVDDSKVKARLNTLSMHILEHAENHDNAGMQIYVREMAELGVTEMCQPQVFQKRTPTCPPVKIEVNGTVKSGSLCVLTCYKYKGQEYDVGYCK